MPDCEGNNAVENATSKRTWQLDIAASLFTRPAESGHAFHATWRKAHVPHYPSTPTARTEPPRSASPDFLCLTAPSLCARLRTPHIRWLILHAPHPVQCCRLFCLALDHCRIRAGGVPSFADFCAAAAKRRGDPATMALRRVPDNFCMPWPSRGPMRLDSAVQRRCRLIRSSKTAYCVRNWMTQCICLCSMAITGVSRPANGLLNLPSLMQGRSLLFCRPCASNTQHGGQLCSTTGRACCVSPLWGSHCAIDAAA